MNDNLNKMCSKSVHGNVDADRALFQAACDLAWLSNAEFAIVAVDTIIGNIDDSEIHIDANAQLLALAREAENEGVSELIFNIAEG